MKTLISAVVCAAALVSAPAFASKDLATAKGCLACHSQGADMKIGPGYQAVAKKYAGQKDADAKTLAAWVLGGAK
jgi:cytochrome c